MTNISCPFCRKKDFKKILRTNQYDLLICANCNLGFLKPMPTIDQLKNFYKKDYFESERQEFTKYKNYSQLKKVLEKESEKRIKEIKKHTQRQTLLDVGCGLGDFLMVARKFGYKTSGNDISDYAGSIIKNNLGLPFYKGQLSKKNLPANKFDVVTAWDVVEHIPAVNECFEALNSALKKGGFLFLTTPSLESPDAKILGKLWYGFKKIPEHLVFYSPQSISKVLTNHGFKVLSIQNWGFERDIDFIISKLDLYIPFFAKVATPIAQIFKLGEKSIYLPLTDMFVAAKKVR